MVMVRHLSVDLGAGQILFFQNLFAILAIVPWIIFTGGVRTRTRHLKLHVIRALIGTVSMGIYFYVLTKIPLTQARAIALSEPLIASLLAIIILKEKTGFHRIASIVVGIIGAFIVVSPSGENVSIYTALMIVPVILWSYSDVIVKQLSTSERSTTQLLYLTSLMTAFSLPYALLDWQSDLDIRLLVWMAALGIVFAINVVGLFMAFKNAEVGVVMPFDFSGLIFTAILAFIFYGEVLTMNTLIGGAIIMMSSVYFIHRESMHKKKELKGKKRKPWYRLRMLPR